MSPTDLEVLCIDEASGIQEGFEDLFRLGPMDRGAPVLEVLKEIKRFSKRRQRKKHFLFIQNLQCPATVVRHPVGWGEGEPMNIGHPIIAKRVNVEVKKHPQHKRTISVSKEPNNVNSSVITPFALVVQSCLV